MQTSQSRRVRSGRRTHSTSNSRPSGRRSFSERGNSRRGSSAHRGNKRVTTSFDPTQFINKNPVEKQEEVYVPKHTFADFAIDSRLKRTLADIGHTTPSPIQDQVIPEILLGNDVVGLAETGTGKTAAFLLPLIELKKNNLKSPTLILTPTRELAIQVDVELRKLAKGFNFFSTVCVGGTGIGPQIRQLRRQNQFIIGTPGRIKDLIARNVLNTKSMTSVVLDEADRMLDMGFIHDMRDILSNLPTQRQTLFFSATMDDKTKKIVHDFMEKPVIVSVKKKDVTNSIAQDVVPYSSVRKYDTLVELFTNPELKRVIIFGAMKHSVEKLGKELNRSGIPAESIHGNKSHGQRQRSLQRFKSGQVRVLVATDVAARGIHVDNVSHVINYDLPNCFSDYVHRIGRTGRGDKHGKALTFIPEKTLQR